MSEGPKQESLANAGAGVDDELAPITAMMSSRLIVLANLLRRGALLRYKRMAGLSSVEFGLVASLGRRPPMSVVRLAAAVGLVAHDAVLAGALERNQHLLEKLSEAEAAMLLGHIDGLTDIAAQMLAAEKDLV